MRLSSTSIRIRPCEIDTPVEMQGPIRVDVDIEGFEVSRSVDEPDLSCLHKVIGDDDVLLIRRDLDIVGSDGRLDLIWIIEALHILQIGDIEGCDMIARCVGSFVKCQLILDGLG